MMLPRQFGEPGGLIRERRESYSARRFRLRPSNWPTVQEVYDATLAGRRAAVRQILRGDAATYPEPGAPEDWVANGIIDRQAKRRQTRGKRWREQWRLRTEPPGWQPQWRRKEQ